MLDDDPIHHDNDVLLHATSQIETHLAKRNTLKLIGVCNNKTAHGGDLQQVPNELLACILMFVGDDILIDCTDPVVIAGEVGAVIE